MAGYHDELTNGADFNASIGHINDRINDVENVNQYNRDMEDYENRVKANEKEIEDFNRLPWYKKIGKSAPEKLKAEPPKYPDLKTGVYLRPNKSDGLLKQAERYKKNREKNLSAYRRLLKRK